MVSDTTISTAALAVALVALVSTISQVLGQFFATADGYRRCQPSVMGGWAKLTRRKFRWSEFRFETIYTIPHFSLSTYEGKPIYLETSRRSMGSMMVRIPRYPLDGSDEMLRKTYCQSGRMMRDWSDSADEMASWVNFIEVFHRNSSQTLRCMQGLIAKAHTSEVVVHVIEEAKEIKQYQGYLIPFVTPRKRSWDFVPPEVIRPLALVAIGDIAIMVRRLGMLWKEFDPSNGALRAEGNGHTLSSTVVRSMGTVLDISLREDNRPQRSIDELYVPTEAADKMGFGILPGRRKLRIPDHRLGTDDEMFKDMRDLGGFQNHTIDQLKGLMTANPGWMPGVSDIIGFAAPMLRQYGSSIIRVPQPAVYVAGLTMQEEGLVVFYKRLKDRIAERASRGERVSEQTNSILEQYEELSQRYGKQWEDQNRCEMNRTSITFLDDLHTKHNATTDYFDALQSKYVSGLSAQHFRYTDLMYSHIIHGINYFPDANARINATPSQARDNYGLSATNWITEGAHVYFDNIPKVAESMKQRGFDNPEIVEEAWFTMMFRAFLWHRTHFMVEGPRVPSMHWASRLPVYIG